MEISARSLQVTVPPLKSQRSSGPRIIFAGTPQFAAVILAELLLHYPIAAVYTQPDRPSGRGRKLVAGEVKQLADRHSIPVYQPHDLHDKATVDAMRALAPDLLIVVAFGLILPPMILSIPTFGCINVHASLLPRWRGASPIQHAILAGDRETGITIICMDEGLDTGPIIGQAVCKIDNHETAASLHDRLAHLGAAELVSTINKIQNHGVVLSPQTDEGVTYAPKIRKQQACIDWSKSALQLDREIRAFNPWPVAYTWLANGQRLRLWEAQPFAAGHAASPGTIVRTLKGAIDVATGNGILRILRVQRAGGRIISVSEFIRAYGAMVAPGQTLRGS